MKPKAMKHYQKYGGMWIVVHSDLIKFSKQVSAHYTTESEAQAAMVHLSDKYPPEQLYTVKEPTLEEARAGARESKERHKLDVTFYSLTGVPVRDSLKMYASRFRAVRELRKAKRRYPGARLGISTTFYCKDELEGRDMQMRRVIR